MQLRTRMAAALGIAAAATLALPGCHKATPSDARAKPQPPASLKSLLDYNAVQTARIVAAAGTQPAKLDRAIVNQGQPYPNFLWSIGLRTSQPFRCVTAVATQVRCYAELSWAGSDQVAGYADVIMYDHDVTLADLLTDRDYNDPAGLGQTVRTTTVAMYSSGPAAANGLQTTCRQPLGSTSNGPATCFSLLGPRIVLLAWMAANPPVTGSDGTPEVSLKPNFVVAAMEKMIRQFREAASNSSNDSPLAGRKLFGAEMDFSDAGWYASNPGFIFRDSLYAGPYSDEAACQADLTRASTAYAQFVREAETIDHCAYYAKEPDGL